MAWREKNGWIKRRIFPNLFLKRDLSIPFQIRLVKQTIHKTKFLKVFLAQRVSACYGILKLNYRNSDIRVRGFMHTTILFHRIYLPVLMKLITLKLIIWHCLTKLLGIQKMPIIQWVDN
jgi:hypothetical protein